MIKLYQRNLEGACTQNSELVEATFKTKATPIYSAPLELGSTQRCTPVTSGWHVSLRSSPIHAATRNVRERRQSDGRGGLLDSVEPDSNRLAPEGQPRRARNSWHLAFVDSAECQIALKHVAWGFAFVGRA